MTGRLPEKDAGSFGVLGRSNCAAGLQRMLSVSLSDGPV